MDPNIGLGILILLLAQIAVTLLKGMNGSESKAREALMKGQVAFMSHIEDIEKTQNRIRSVSEQTLELHKPVGGKLPWMCGLPADFTETFIELKLAVRANTDATNRLVSALDTLEARE